MTQLDDFFEARIADLRDVHMVLLEDDPTKVYPAVAFRSAGVDIVFLPPLDELGMVLDMHIFVDDVEIPDSPRLISIRRNTA